MKTTSGYAVLDKAMYGTKDRRTVLPLLRVRMPHDSDGGTTRASFRFVSVSFERRLPCLCSDTVTILWCRAREHDKRSVEERLSKLVIVKHLATLGRCTALGGRQGSQDTEQDCAMGETSIRIWTRTC